MITPTRSVHGCTPYFALLRKARLTTNTLRLFPQLFPRQLAAIVIALLCTAVLMITPDAQAQAAPEQEQTPVAQGEPPAPASNPAAQTTRVAVTDPAILTAGDLQQAPDPFTEALSLALPDDATVTVFFRPQQQYQARGAVLLLADETAHPLSTTLIDTLRTGLPATGWATLAVPLLPGPATATPARTLPPMSRIRLTPTSQQGAPNDTTPQNDTASVAAPASQTDEAAALDKTAATDEQTAKDEQAAKVMASVDDKPRTEPAWLPNNRQRSAAALTALQSKQPAPMVLLGYGTGAYWAATLAQPFTAHEAALVIINPRTPATQDSTADDANRQDLSTLLSRLNVPVYDLFSLTPDQQQRQQLRQQAAQQAPLAQYQPVPLPRWQVSEGGNWWLQRVSGILHRYERYRQTLPAGPIKQEERPSEQPPGLVTPQAQSPTN